MNKENNAPEITTIPAPAFRRITEANAVIVEIPSEESGTEIQTVAAPVVEPVAEPVSAREEIAASIPLDGMARDCKVLLNRIVKKTKKKRTRGILGMDVTSLAISERKLPWEKASPDCKLSGLADTETALRLAGLDYDVGFRMNADVHFNEQTQAIELNQTPEWGVWKQGANACRLGSVGGRYHIIQNKEAFGLLDRFMGDGSLLVETAGALDNGALAWMLARIPSEAFNNVSDKISIYVLFTNSFNGTQTFSAQLVPIRVVCKNTLNMALGKARNRYAIRHTPTWESQVSQMRDVLNLAQNTEKVWAEIVESFRLVSLTKDQFIDGYLDKIIPIEGLEKAALTRATNRRDTVISLFDRGVGNEGRTLWDGWNAISEFSSHHSVNKQTGDERSLIENNFKSQIFDESDLQNRYFNLARSHVVLSRNVLTWLEGDAEIQRRQRDAEKLALAAPTVG